MGPGGWEAAAEQLTGRAVDRQPVPQHWQAALRRMSDVAGCSKGLAPPSPCCLLICVSSSRALPPAQQRTRHAHTRGCLSWEQHQAGRAAADRLPPTMLLLCCAHLAVVGRRGQPPVRYVNVHMRKMAAAQVRGAPGRSPQACRRAGAGQATCTRMRVQCAAAALHRRLGLGARCAYELSEALSVGLIEWPRTTPTRVPPMAPEGGALQGLHLNGRRHEMAAIAVLRYCCAALRPSLQLPPAGRAGSSACRGVRSRHGWQRLARVPHG